MKRTVRDIEFLNPEEMYEQFIVNFPEAQFTYRKTVARAKALISAAYILGLRISNILEITRKQIVVEGDYAIVKQVRINKRRKEVIIKDLPMPLSGPRAAFTLIILEYAEKLKPEQKLFPISRNGAYKLIRKATGKWCHYFRSQDFSYEIGLTNRSAVAQMKGVKSSASLEPYDHSTYKQYEDVLNK